MGDGRVWLSVPLRRLPPWVVVRVVGMPAWSTRAYDETEWRDALVVVEQGEIELECAGGGRRRFERGAVLWLTGLPLRALHNRGPEPALLVSVSRRSRGGPVEGETEER